MQKRYYDFNSVMSALATQEAHSALVAPGLLFGAEPLITAEDTITIAPHGVMFASGILLRETEEKEFQINTAGGTQNLSLVYEHENVDLIGGAAATLTLQSGLLQTNDDRVVLLWVRYPGGGVPLTQGMLYPAEQAIVKTPLTFGSGLQYANAPTSVRTVAGTTTVPKVGAWVDMVVPGAGPYTVAMDVGDVLVANGPPNIGAPNGNLRAVVKATGEVLTETTGAPGAGEFALDYSSHVVTFNAADATKVVSITDLTYGTEALLIRNTTGSSVLDEYAFTFTAQEPPPRQVRVFAATALGSAPSLSVVSVLDTTGASTTLESLSPITDGAEVALPVRLVGGTFEPGKTFTVLVRIYTQATSASVLLGCGVSPFNQPF